MRDQACGEDMIGSYLKIQNGQRGRVFGAEQGGGKGGREVAHPTEEAIMGEVRSSATTPLPGASPGDSPRGWHRPLTRGWPGIILISLWKPRSKRRGMGPYSNRIEPRQCRRQFAEARQLREPRVARSEERRVG